MIIFDAHNWCYFNQHISVNLFYAPENGDQRAYSLQAFLSSALTLALIF